MTPPKFVARCPAKINLILRVLSRRKDGYHELDTLFQAVDLWDTLEIRPGKGLSLACNTPGLTTGDDNLVLRAARALRDRHGIGAPGAALVLTKSIPLQAGLGGGSSNAAAALLLCSRFWGLDISAEDLAALAGELGADVPFFLHGGTARGTGRGDRIEPLEFIGERPIVLGHPPFGIPTAEVFRGTSGRLTLPGNGVSVPLLSGPKWPEEKDFWFLANDLEAWVFERWPELVRFRDALLGTGAQGALLSGSGSTVYGVFPGQQGIGAACRKLRREFPHWRILETRSIDGAAHVRGPAE